MLHAVKYLLIAMQFPQVHKILYDDDVEFSVRRRRPEVNYQIDNFSDHRLSSHRHTRELFSALLPLNLKMYKLQLNFEP
jgi:hypothetical protein